MALEAKGSSPFTHLAVTATKGYRQAVRHSTLTAALAGSNPASPVFEYHGALAQSVEHLTFNQVVRGSNPRCFIFKRRNLLRLFFSGCGSAWLERLVWDQEVAGSNPVTPILV